MEYKNQAAVVDEEDDEEEEIELPSSTSLGYNPPPPPPPPIRGSAFSKPVLNPFSSLISPSRGGGGSGSGSSAARNSGFYGITMPSSVHPTTAAAVDHQVSLSVVRNSDPVAVGGATTPDSKSTAAARNSTSAATADVSVRYKECLRNHAAGIGGHVLDGCGEFMPEGEPSTPGGLKCAACGCHRSFHRKETDGDNEATDPYYRVAARPALLLPPPPQHHHHHKQFPFGSPTTPSSALVAFGGNASASGGTTTESSSEERINAGAPTPATAQRKRFRTKFTVEQKEKMLAFADRVGWRIQKQDEAQVQEFCAKAGVRRQVLKVWMHNNKHLFKKQQQPANEDEPSAQQHLHQPHPSQD
ncbi:zinc-finger homeodomain protein 6-like [Musa acuminata AAA Group]|uniref:zinc-finger homeodomain protein 6-like n=1 Tax=Musa acuminata AAA Group TaxID=214697 RepID=UPI0031D9558D